MNGLIGISGLAGVGKDTLADHLVDCYGYVKMACADPIKKLLNDCFGWRDEQWNDRQWKEDLLAVTWNQGTMSASPRQLAQWLGTEVGRTIGGDDIWIQKLWTNYCHGNGQRPLVITDIRFDNEALFIRQRGGIVVRIVRDVASVAKHVSENGVSRDLIDAQVSNTGAREDFLARAVATLKEFRIV